MSRNQGNICPCCHQELNNNKFNKLNIITPNKPLYTQENYESFECFEMNMKKGDVIFVYADWCGHCRNFAPLWEQFKKSFENDFNFVKVPEAKIQNESDLPSSLKMNTNARNNLEMALKSVRGFPTLLFIDKGGNIHEIYNRNNLMEEIKKFI